MTELQIAYEDFFAPGQGQRVTVASDHGDNRVGLIISNTREGVPPAVLIRCGGMAGVINFAGATKIRAASTCEEEDLRRQMFEYFVSVFGGDPRYAFQTYQFGALSGGTRVLEKGLSEAPPTGTMTIVEVPGLIHRLNPLVRTAGHAPRTAATVGYAGDHSSFSLMEKANTDTIANPDIHFLWLVQPNASDRSDWSGDVELYLDLMTDIRRAGAGKAAQFVWSGGTVTIKEIWGALARGIPVLLPRGSGRAVDNTILALDGEFKKVTEGHGPLLEEMLADPKVTPHLGLVTVVDSNDPLQAQCWLQDLGFGQML